MADSTDKRRIDRVRLYAPITARVEEQRVTVVDVSSIGARIEHGFPLAIGSNTHIVFAYHGVHVGIDCQVVRCKLDRSVLRGNPSYTSGIQFINPDDPAVGILLEMLHAVVNEDFAARKVIATKKKSPAKKVAKKVARAKPKK